MRQNQPTQETLEEFRNNVLDKVDLNRDGKIELGEFARFDTGMYYSMIIMFNCFKLKKASRVQTPSDDLQTILKNY